MLIKGRFVSEDRFLELLMIALTDHEQAFKSLTESIRDMKQSISHTNEKVQRLEFMMEELNDLKKSMMAAMVEIEESKKSMAASWELMKNELQKLKGSTTVKPRNMALCFLCLALIGWFVIGHMNGVEEAFSQLMLSP